MNQSKQIVTGLADREQAAVHFQEMQTWLAQQPTRENHVSLTPRQPADVFMCQLFSAWWCGFWTGVMVQKSQNRPE
jgi:hypothetical protein